MSFDAVEQSLQYTFSDKDLLERALTHKSTQSGSYERLEFLGDAVLGLTIAQYLYQHFPAWPEGDLSRARAALVKGDTLSRLSVELGLVKHVLLGPGEILPAGGCRPSIAADVFEALMGAVYLDTGLSAAQSVILACFSSRLNTLGEHIVSKDAKTILQEWTQAKKYTLPRYTLEKAEGLAHARVFFICCDIEGLSYQVRSSATTRRKAEQQAALVYLDYLKKEGLC